MQGVVAHEGEPLLAHRSNNTNDIDTNNAKQYNSNTRKWPIIGGIIIVALLISIGYFAKVALFDGSPMNSTANHVYQFHTDAQWERRAAPLNPAQWKLKEQVPEQETITMRITLSKQNTDSLMEKVLEVSHPSSSKYGEFYTREQIKDMFKPTDESLEVVYAWLATYDIDSDDISVGGALSDTLSFVIAVGKANMMLRTTYQRYSHDDSDMEHVRAKDSFSLPDSLKEHITLITPGFHMPPSKHIRDIKLFTGGQPENPRDRSGAGNGNSDDNGLTFVDPYVYPAKLKEYYWMDTSETGGSENNAQCVASFLSEYYNSDDLSQFWSAFKVGESSLTNIPEDQESGDGDEAELDVQYITSTGQGVTTYVWDTEDDSYFISLVENVIDSDYDITVVSMSYGGAEQAEGEDYCEEVSDLFGIATLLGITFFASSGDSGASYDGELLDDQYAPTFPASSPYVVAVGGTSDGSITTDIDDDTNEEGWYYSGGGFSTFFDRPSWQDTAVEYYLANVDTLPDSSYYDSSMRAFPDISARGNYYVIVIDGGYYAVSGTSASCPTIAGMFSMLNEERLAAGKSTFGLLSPLLYEIFDSEDFGTLFNDPIQGYNEGITDDDGIAYYCCEGWDPITGVGTPKFNKIKSLFINDNEDTSDSSE